MSKKYDLLVVGGGSGGLAHAQRAAEYGVNVAVVEHGPLGGTCVNVGCVPKKVMWYAAHYAQELKYAADYGYDVSVKGHDWAALKSRRDAYIARLNNIYETNLDKRDVTYIAGDAKFIDANTITVGNKRYQAERVVIATGGQPIVPSIPGAELGITSDGFFALEQQPRRVLIAGSGYVAVELAGVLNGLGSETKVIVRKDGVLRGFDKMLSSELIDTMRKSGIEIKTGVVPASVRSTDNGLVLTAEDGREFGPVDTLLWAVGRSPNTATLDLDKAGVDMDARGFVPTDEMQSTNVEHIYALGDVTGRAALTPVAIAAGRRLADRLYGGMVGRHLDYSLIPTVIFSHPTIGTVGMTEDEARVQYGDDIKVYTTGFTPMFYALGEDRQRSAMKLITAGEDERVIGVHIFGDGADEMLQGFAVAMRMGATKKDLDDTVAIHPTNAEEIVTMRE
ncbi:MAG: glutathione-disulfide reductase [Gammaproteobacteria bacterium]|nr:glutathione-disulfide reductase [Gammaproteobacteria bacterium]